MRRHLDLSISLGLVGLAVALNAPYLTAGFSMDDYLLVEALLEEPQRFSRLVGVWGLREVEAFTGLWWAGPDWEGRLFRPVASLLFEASLRLFGRSAAPLHALALLSHGLAAAMLFRLLRALGEPRAAAGLAALFFVGCERLTLVVGWVSTMTDPLALVGMGAALLLHRSFLATRRPARLLGSMLAFAFALGCKESAVVLPALVIGLTAAAPEGRLERALSPRERLQALVAARWALLPTVALGAAYLVAYRALSLGAMHNLAYVSPLQEPLEFLRHAAVQLPILWLGLLTNLWPSFGMFEPRLVPALALLGLLALAALLPEVVRLRREPVALGSFLACAVALVPQASTDASERGLYVPVWLLAPLLATLALQSPWLHARLAPGRPRAPRYGRLAGLYVTLSLLLPGLVLTPALVPAMKASLAQGERELLTALPHVAARRPTDVVLVDLSGAMAALSPPSIFRFHAVPARLHVLSAANGAFSLQRLDEHTLRLATPQDGWLTSFFARLVRTEPALTIGRPIVRGPLTATIVELSPDGRDARAVEFRFDRPLGDAGWLFLRWDGAAFVPFDPAELPLGEPLALFDSSDVLASMGLR